MEARVIKGVSKKSNNPYTAIDIQLTPAYSKRVFLDPAEEALVEISSLSDSVNANK